MNTVENSDNMQDLFPLTLARGEAFCNREKERQLLKDYIMSGTHVWIQAHRRYGKTSLIEQTVSDMKAEQRAIQSTRVDLLVAATPEDICRKLLTSIGNVAAKLPKGSIESLAEKIFSFFKRLKVDVSLNAGGPQVRFAATSDPDTIYEALRSLDELAKSSQSRALIHIDEFQNLAEIEGARPFEAAIRGALQEAQNTTFIFSGSNRRLMEQAFTDKKRPLYQHCRVMLLKRIEKNRYQEHLQQLSQARWGDVIGVDIVEKIMALTERHAFYMNSLCATLWRLPSLPSTAQVDEAWDLVLEETRQAAEPQFSGLNANHRKMMRALAMRPTDEPFSKEFSQQSDISVGSIRTTIDKLLFMDLIEKDGDGIYRLVDPALSALLRRDV